MSAPLPFVMRASLLLAFGLAAGCAPGPTEPGDDDDSTEAADDDDATAPLGTARVAGRVALVDGEGIADLTVSLCGGICLVADTDSEGAFLFPEVPEGPKVIEPAVVPVGDDLAVSVRSWTRFFDFVDVGEGEDITLAPITLHRVPDAQGPLTGPQDMQLLPDLHVAFDVSAILDAGLLPLGADDVWLGAVPLPPADWPTEGLDGWTVHAAWGLAIWDLEAEDGFAVTVSLPAAMPPGDDVAFLVADYNYGFAEGRFFVEEAELSADGLTLTTPSTGGLDRATMWIAASRPPTGD
ncbi:MAG: hypothetical protein KDA24_11480 [Deltaproteobacteria bacterium]|nr:hypothetical protein [Deltaproteobacteria bacterium]